MSAVLAVFKREFNGYFATPLAYVFIVIFLFLTGAMTFYIGNFFERGQADLRLFFGFHPWLYLFLVPAVSMRLWAEERKSGTIELLLTLPISIPAAVIGKHLAAWAFVAVALALTFPVWITVNYLGDPDNGIIIAGYIGSLLMAGAYLAIGSCLSAITSSQVIAFVLSIAVCFLFTVSGLPLVIDVARALLPGLLVDTIAGMSFLTHFDSILNGVIDLRDLIYFLSLMGFFLYATVVAVDLKRG